MYENFSNLKYRGAAYTFGSEGFLLYFGSVFRAFFSSRKSPTFPQKKSLFVLFFLCSLFLSAAFDIVTFVPYFVRPALPPCAAAKKEEEELSGNTVENAEKGRSKLLLPAGQKQV